MTSAARLLAGLALVAPAVLALRTRAGGDSPEYYWPHARGHVGSYSVTEHTAPANLTAAVSWSWHHPKGQYYTTVVSAPLIDDKKNIYIASEDGVRKFSHDGKELWYYAPRGSVATCPSLMSGSLFGNTQNGWVFALDMETGREVWAEKKAKDSPGDTGYVEAHDGLVLAGMDSGMGGGAMRVLGVEATTGKTLWEYRSDVQLWNIQPQFTGDGHFVTMDVHGGVYKRSVKDGALVWKTLPRDRTSFSDGGVILGPDGTAYTCSNADRSSGKQGEHGALRAYAREDGRLLWDRFLEYPCNSWPVVTPDGSSVIVPTGSFVDVPAALHPNIMLKYRKRPEQMQNLSLSLADKELETYGLRDSASKPRTAAVRAFSARTGEPQWSTELPPYGRMSARGDEEGVFFRMKNGKRPVCLPAQFSAPTLSGDGKVYVGRADGLLYAMESGTGKYETFNALSGFLHPGTGWAPGLMAVTTCDGLYVWEF